jgi:hypothetical protein
MPLALTDRIVALLVSLTDEQIQALAPAERTRLADQCLRVAVRATPVAEAQPKSLVTYPPPHRRDR